jgi:uncharacterized protein (TIGR03435 family)
MTRLGLLLAVFVTITLQPLGAQSNSPRFEVASVKPAPPPQPVGPGLIVRRPSPPGSFNRTATVASLIQLAYELQVEQQVVGGPQWLRDDRFEIAARAGREAPFAEMRLMVRSLLAERFKLVAHSEQREMPTYALVLARSDKRLGPGLKKSDDECKSLVEQPRNAPPGAVRATGCGSMTTFVNTGAAPHMAAPVIDATGLVGSFEWSFFYDAQGSVFSRGVSPDATDPSAPQYPTALQEQLGLKLESRRAPIAVIVIDSVEQPTPD